MTGRARNGSCSVWRAVPGKCPHAGTLNLASQRYLLEPHCEHLSPDEDRTVEFSMQAHNKFTVASS